MLLMSCQKCGKQCERGSGAQKFCRACSPWKKDLANGLAARQCIKCGGEYIPNSARQKYCRECSPHFPHYRLRTITPKNPKTKLPPLKKPLNWFRCCRCDEKISPAPKNQVNFLRELPCEKCKEIVERQQKAKDIKWNRERKKFKRKFYKLMLEDKDYYVNYRFVYQEEIDKMRENINKSLVNEYQEKMSNGWKNLQPPQIYTGPVAVLVNAVLDSSFAFSANPVDEWIEEPGFYRVKNSKPNDLYFYTPERGGFLHCNSRRYDAERLHRVIEKNKPNWREIQNKIADKKYFDAKRKEIKEAPINQKSKQFFAMLAVSSAMTKTAKRKAK
jgi:hypothetical protein